MNTEGKILTQIMNIILSSGCRVGRFSVGRGEEGVRRLRLPSGLMLMLMEVEVMVMVALMSTVVVVVERKESEDCDLIS